MDAVSLAIAAKEGHAQAVSHLIAELEGIVRFVATDVDYLVASLPITAIDRLVSDARIEAVSVDTPSEGFLQYAGGFVDYESSGEDRVPVGSEKDSKQSGGGSQIASAPKRQISPLEEQYPILRDMAGSSFADRHPTYDGRGVVIAHVEDFPDFLAPELQTAFDLQGRRIEKFADIVSVASYSPSLAQNLDPIAVGVGRFRLTEVEQYAGYANFDGSAYRLVGDGRCLGGEFTVPNETYYERIFDLLAPQLGSEKRWKEGQVKEVISRGMVWCEPEQALRIDLNNDKDFRNDEPIGDFGVSGDIGVFGLDDPSTSVRDSIGYAVRKTGSHVEVMYGADSHATMAAGAAVASHGTSGRVKGIAPGAQLVSIAHGKRTTSFGQAMVYAFADSRVDVVLIEGYFSANAVNSLKDGRSVLAIVLDRLVRTYQKPAFFTAFNAPGMSSAIDVANGKHVLSIGAYHSAQSVLANNGARIQFEDNLHWTGAEGPSGDGAIKPDFLAPANPLSIGAGYRPGTTVEGAFELPPGYRIGSGTSTATPVAAGVAALLISAAKQRDMKWNAFRINWAVRSTARFLPGIPAYKQGRGLIQLDSAWEALQWLSTINDMIEISVAAPVQTTTSHLLKPANIGDGLFEREGWSVGELGRRTIMLTRTGGPVSADSFDIEWVGDDHEAFASVDRIDLPLSEPTEFHVDINIGSVGAHSALAQLRRRDIPGVVASIPVTVVAPLELNEQNNFSQQTAFELDRPGRKNIFVRVPKGTSKLSVAFQADRAPLGARLLGPSNLALGQAIYIATQPNGVGANSLSYPEPGVWQITFLERSDMLEFDRALGDEQYLPPVNVSLGITASAVRVSESPESKSETQKWSIENRLAPTVITGRYTIAEYASESRALVVNQHILREFQVPKPTSTVVVEVQPSGESIIDVDLYLFDCARARCKLEKPAVSSAAHERVFVNDPSAGKWKAIVFAHGPMYQKGRFDYRQYFLSSELPRVSTGDAGSNREIDELWSTQSDALDEQVTGAENNHCLFLVVEDVSVMPLPKAVVSGSDSLEEGNSTPIGYACLETNGREALE